MLLPEQDIASWLAKRRPEVWRRLGDRQHELNDQNAVQVLLEKLHNSDALSLKTKALYNIVNEHIQAHPGLIWPMLVRAEGWYHSRHILEEKRGGKRPGAGSRCRPESVGQGNSESTT
jgi:hypothetical protein